MTALNALPNSWSYLYPDTNDYYYRYGDGYLYQVDRHDNLIANLLPLMASPRDRSTRSWRCISHANTTAGSSSHQALIAPRQTAVAMRVVAPTVARRP